MPSFDWIVSLAGFGVGTIVGLTGMGGGALMTPILVLLFGIPPHIAVGSDLTASLFMKPLGAFVHARRGTVHRGLVGWLCLGSVPSSFAGAALVNHLGHNAAVEGTIRRILGVTLVVAAAAMLGKWTLTRRRNVSANVSLVPIRVKPVQTVLLGVIGGFVVGMTSVGSGSLLIVMLMLLYPALGGSRLVGTDLAQAIPLVGAAALGHAVFGHIHLDLTLALLVGSVPGVYLGARYSSRAPDHVIRPVLVITLFASAIKLLGGTNQLLGIALATLAAGWSAYAIATRPAVAPDSERDDVTPEPTLPAE